ncbi:MAG: ketopantoate reductase C-terminal domain-containing protein [Ferruginibacter sp.]|nr:ketopantoate reductase family protein [Bacteroidota bacterium]MBX2918905.1 ketopantoate reductase family protein [Ferruginibacter sp.]MCB0710531.1 ketopantoate reductase family protein [Chitinophagaceae bacterium]
MDNCRIFIIGAGAIGKALAVFLKNEDKEVILLRGNIDNIKESYQEIEVVINNKRIVQNIRTGTLSSYPELRGIVVLTNKSFGNKQLAEKLKDRTGTSPIVILQNGLNTESPFIEKGFMNIYRCVLFASSQYIESNKLRFKPASDSLIGIIRGNYEKLTSVISALQNPHLIFRAEENIQPVIWTKAIANSVFNSVCPLLETDNGIFYRNNDALNIAKRVISECTKVAALQGIYLSDDKILEVLLLISKSSDGQLISTYQDILNKRKTEIETFNFAIAEIANHFYKDNLVIETKLLGELVKLKSDLSLNQ